MDVFGPLLLQMEWGADEALEDAPVDRLREAPRAPEPLPARVVQATPAVVPPGTPVERAIRAAAGADTLEELKAAIAGFDASPLRDMATNMVFASGNPGSGLLLIGGPPAADEDRAGAPFAGPDGALLDQMLGSIGLTRAAMLLAPLIPWRPPGGRVPTPGELQLHRPFLMRLIALTMPQRIVLFGMMTAGTVLGATPRARSIGWTGAVIEGQSAQVLILPAIADIRKTPLRRKDAWAGLRALRRALDDVS